MFEYEKEQILGYINYLLHITCISFKILFFFFLLTNGLVFQRKSHTC